ncbi:helix-turn-helix domain-containing protein [Paraburkholderia sp. BCC1885]|uniref:helix-turn-helix domain-containing protein n=1 Tax=Paraburkholderia sp. BCC1885 TaxID=2562669 RepID=UPI0016430C42|nr:helix-turn-helix domain-containing protein [Paraburkholderia sp. BCC1885]
MSVTATFWVRAQRVGKGSPKAVLIALADFAGEDFRVWASMEAVEQFIEQDRKTILANIKRLKELGYLEDTGDRTGKTGQVIVYQMTRPAGAPKVLMTNREGKVVEIGPPPSKLAQIGNGSENGTVKHTQKRNSSKNGTVPNFPANGTVFPAEQSQISAETVPKTGHGTTKELSKEQKGNDQPARRAPRVALHVELRSIELPDWLSDDTWLDWCEHREAKAADKSAPWTRPAASVSIKRLAKLRELGHDPAACVDEAVLRGWTGLFPVKDVQAAVGSPSAPANWWLTESGYLSRGQQLGIDRSKFQFFEQFKAKVCKASGPGEWMEELLRTVGRESEERYEALYAYFNDIPREKAPAEVA